MRASVLVNAGGTPIHYRHNWCIKIWFLSLQPLWTEEGAYKCLRIFPVQYVIKWYLGE